MKMAGFVTNEAAVRERDSQRIWPIRNWSGPIAFNRECQSAVDQLGAK